MDDAKRAVCKKWANWMGGLVEFVLVMFLLCPSVLGQEQRSIATLERMGDAFASVAQKASPAVQKRSEDGKVLFLVSSNSQMSQYVVLEVSED